MQDASMSQKREETKITSQLLCLRDCAIRTTRDRDCVSGAILVHGAAFLSCASVLSIFL